MHASGPPQTGALSRPAALHSNSASRVCMCSHAWTWTLDRLWLNTPHWVAIVERSNLSQHGSGPVQTRCAGCWQGGFARQPQCPHLEDWQQWLLRMPYAQYGSFSKASDHRAAASKQVQGNSWAACWPNYCRVLLGLGDEDGAACRP
jgi:hypothetical protein